MKFIAHALLLFISLVAAPAMADKLNATDIQFAFGGVHATAKESRSLKPVKIKSEAAQKRIQSFEVVSATPLSQKEMKETEGSAFKLLSPGGGGRICGVICGGYGFRMDYRANPSPTMLHFHLGAISSRDWGGHRPWNAPWRTY
ncbi:hypothetical protein [Agrobacterium sp. ST15.13.015]|uniref:hypothetical protein n=1 Tax=Agrobacterium sp. ST15.13.015 TaxID=3017319 RepID=UPI0022BFBFD8|nr:hypothetical protein [Agrobacterium sp. ST15.13.015]MCZ7501299.1 hypothetical protein [Rhizobium rhizogenes]